MQGLSTIITFYNGMSSLKMCIKLLQDALKAEDIYEIRMYFKHLIKSVFMSLFNLPLTNTKLISQYPITYTLYSDFDRLQFYVTEINDH